MKINHDNRRSYASVICIISFIGGFIGLGLFFLLKNTEQPFSKVHPLSILTISIAIYFFYIILCYGKKDANELMDKITQNLFNNCITQMILIFFFSGIFSSLTTMVRCNESLTNFLLTILPTKAILLAIFLSSSAISISIGTSVSTITIMTPIALSFVSIINPLHLAGAIISGAYFGDNLSLISDTTIASIQIHKADLVKKLKINLKIAIIPFISICIIMYFLGYSIHADGSSLSNLNYNIILILPYLLIIVLGLIKVNVIIALSLGILFTVIIALFSNCGITEVSLSISKGLMNMVELNTFVILSALIGTLVSVEGGFDLIEKIISKNNNASYFRSMFVIFIILLINNAIMANNTIAIILTGALIKRLFDNVKMDKSAAASITDNFSCGVHGLLPYAPQVLFLANAFNISIFNVIKHSYYCIFLLFFTLLFIIYCNKVKLNDNLK